LVHLIYNYPSNHHLHPNQGPIVRLHCCAGLVSIQITKKVNPSHSFLSTDIPQVACDVTESLPIEAVRSSISSLRTLPYKHCKWRDELREQYTRETGDDDYRSLAWEAWLLKRGEIE
jgi:hypothetical protein